MHTHTLILFSALAFFGLWYDKGLAMALNYLALGIGLVISAICFRLAFEIWRARDY